MAGYWEREGGEAMKNRGRDPCGGSWCTALHLMKVSRQKEIC